MKSFKEYLQEQKQIEEGLGRWVGDLVDSAAKGTVKGISKAIVGTAKGIGKAGRAVNRGIKNRGGYIKTAKDAIGLGLSPVTLPLKAIGSVLGGGGHGGKGLKDSEKEDERKEGAARERRDRQTQEDAARQAEEIEMKKHGFHPGKVGRREAYRHWKVTHANLAKHNPGNADHDRAMISGTKFHPQSQNPGTIP